MTQPIADHPHIDPGDGRTECHVCGKWIRRVTHSCKGVPVTEAARQRWRDDQQEAAAEMLNEIYAEEREA